jgi:hypothetical protein
MAWSLRKQETLCDPVTRTCLERQMDAVKDVLCPNWPAVSAVTRTSWAGGFFKAA